MSWDRIKTSELLCPPRHWGELEIWGWGASSYTVDSVNVPTQRHTTWSSVASNSSSLRGLFHLLYFQIVTNCPPPIHSFAAWSVDLSGFTLYFIIFCIKWGDYLCFGSNCTGTLHSELLTLCVQCPLPSPLTGVGIKIYQEVTTRDQSCPQQELTLAGASTENTVCSKHVSHVWQWNG